VHAVKRELFREPRHGAHYWLILFVGCVELISILLFPLRQQTPRLVALFIGLMLVSLAAPELLPKNMIRFAGLLRVVGILVTLVAVLLGVVALLSG